MDGGLYQPETGKEGEVLPESLAVVAGSRAERKGSGKVERGFPEYLLCEPLRRDQRVDGADGGTDRAWQKAEAILHTGGILFLSQRDPGSDASVCRDQGRSQGLGKTVAGKAGPGDLSCLPPCKAGV